jgi:glucokinase
LSRHLRDTTLEDHIGECTLKERTGGRFETTLSLLEAVRNGDQAACKVWGDSLEALTAAVVSFINIFDPEVIVLGGGVARAGDVLFKALTGRVSKAEWKPYGKPVPIIPAQLSGWAGTYGAAYAGLSADSGSKQRIFAQ